MLLRTTLLATLVLSSSAVLAQTGNVCSGLPTYAQLKAALDAAVFPAVTNGGLDFDMWATIVADDGTVCAIAKTGSDINDQWLGSRVISAQKANTANAFSLNNGLALSTANLYSAVQPGGSLFGLQESNPVDTAAAYKGTSSKFGTATDPMVGTRIGGVNVFGGGLGLYKASGQMVGGLGVSGDTSCADHNVAWRVRDLLLLDKVPAGLSGALGDNIIYDIVGDKSTSGWGHPLCGADDQADNAAVVAVHPLN
jgi:uncharacterized protein GlcG (DUF336 family)